MHDQEHHDVGVSEDRAHVQMFEALLQPRFETQSLKKRLQNNQSGKGGELLVFKSDLILRRLSGLND